MKAFSKELKQYFKKRDAAISRLTKCETDYATADIERAGFVNTQSYYFDEDGDQYEFHVFKRDNETIVVTQVYVEKEGGLYYQSMYADAERKPEVTSFTGI